MFKKMFESKYELTLVTILTLAFGFEFLDRLAMSFMLPIIQPELGITNEQIGILGFINTGAYSASAIIFGIIMDRIGGRKQWLLFWMFTTFLSTAACVWVTTYDQLIIIRALVGITEGPLLGLFGAMLIHCNPKNFGRNFGTTNAGVGLIAVTFGPVMVTQVLKHFSWQMTYLLVSLPTLIIFFFILFWVKEVKTDPKLALKQREMLQDAGGFAAMFKNRNVIVCTILAVCMFGGYWTLMLFAPLYLVKVAGMSVQKMGWISSTMGILYITYCILIPKLSDLYGRKVVMIITAICCTTGPLLMALLPGSTLSIIGYVLFGGTIPSVIPLIAGVIPMESVVENLRTSANGLISGIGEFFGGSCLPVVVGKVADSSGLQATMGIGAMLLGISVALGFGLKESNPSILKKQGKEPIDPTLAPLITSTKI